MVLDKLRANILIPKEDIFPLVSGTLHRKHNLTEIYVKQNPDLILDLVIKGPIRKEKERVRRGKILNFSLFLSGWIIS